MTTLTEHVASLTDAEADELAARRLGYIIDWSHGQMYIRPPHEGPEPKPEPWNIGNWRGSWSPCSGGKSAMEVHKHLTSICRHVESYRWHNGDSYVWRVTARMRPEIGAGVGWADDENEDRARVNALILLGCVLDKDYEKRVWEVKG